MPNSLNCSAEISDGESIITSRPELFFGKAMVSRMLIQACKHRNQTVETEGDTTMRRSAVFESIQQETELFFSLLRGKSQTFEHPLLQCCIMDPDRTSPYFHAVDHHVVGIRSHISGRVSIKSISSGFGEVNGWCIA